MTRPITSTLKKICLTLIVTQVFSQAVLAQSTPQLNRKFAKKVTVEIKDEPIGKFLNQLAEENKVTIEIDTEALADDGYSVDETISLSLKNVSLFTVVKLAGESLEFTCLPKGNGLFITTHLAAQDALYERQYNLPWIQMLRVDSRSVAAALEQTTPGPWMTIDGEGGEFTAIGPAAYKISQDWENHQVIESILLQIESIVRGRGVTVGSPAERAFMKSLQKSVDQVEGESTITEYLDKLLASNEINFWLDRSELSNEGIASDVMLNFSAGKRPVFAHLMEALKPHGMVPYVEGEVVKITTSLAAEASTVTRVYDVRKQVRQVGSTVAVIDVLQKTAGTGPWFGVEMEGGEVGEVGPLIIIEHNRQAHQVIQEALK